VLLPVGHTQALRTPCLVPWRVSALRSPAHPLWVISGRSSRTAQRGCATVSPLPLICMWL